MERRRSSHSGVELVHLDNPCEDEHSELQEVHRNESNY